MDQNPALENTNQPNPLIRVTSHANHRDVKRDTRDNGRTNGDQRDKLPPRDLAESIKLPGRIRCTTYNCILLYTPPAVGLFPRIDRA